MIQKTSITRLSKGLDGSHSMVTLDGTALETGRADLSTMNPNDPVEQAKITPIIEGQEAQHRLDPNPTEAFRPQTIGVEVVNGEAYFSLSADPFTTMAVLNNVGPHR
jgi:hypothetical protein